MAMTTKQSGVARKSKPTGAKHTAPVRILQPAKGPRTVSHRKIKEAVDKVFRDRADARA